MSFYRKLLLTIIALFVVSNSYTVVAQVQRITLLDLSHDSSLIAMILNKQLVVRSLDDPQSEVSVSGFLGNVTALAWSADNSKLAFGTGEYDQGLTTGKVYIWDVGTESIVATSGDQDGVVVSILWSDGNSKILSGAERADGGGLYLFDLTASQTTEINGTSSFDLSPSPDGSQIALGLLTGSISILNASTFDRELRVPRFTEPIGIASYITWHPSGLYVASGHTDGTILVWDKAFGNVQFTLSGASTIELRSDDNYVTSIRALAFDPEGRFLKSINGEGIVRTFDAYTGDQIAEKQVEGPVYTADWNSDATEVVYGIDSDDPQFIAAAELTNQSALDLATVCSPSPITYRTWRVRNPNDTDSTFGWTLLGDSLQQQGYGTVPPAVGVLSGEAFLSTSTISGDNELQLTVNGIVQATVVGASTQCAAQTAPPVNLELTSLCSPLAAGYRVWHVSNPNASELVFTWELDQSAQQGSGIVPASGETTFLTRPETGDPAVTLLVNNVSQQTAADNAWQCSPSGLIMQYYAESTTRTTLVESIIPQLNIVNTSDSAIDLTELTIRYYFTKDSTTQPLEGYCAWTALPDNCDEVTVTTGTLSTPVTGADSYLEVGFTSGTVDANSQTLDIIVRANKQDWSDFDQSDDYSFDPTSTSDTWVTWTKVTLYQNDVLVWGTEPQ